MKNAKLYVLCEGMGLVMIGMLEQLMEYVKTLVPEVEEFTDFGFGSAYLDPVYLLGELEEKPEEAIVTALMKNENGRYEVRVMSDSDIPELIDYLDRNMDSGENTVTLFNRFFEESDEGSGEETEKDDGSK